MELNRLFDFMEQVYQGIDVKAVFGNPEHINEKTLIPVARICYALGLGFGEGNRPAEEEVEDVPSGSGSGGGGGGLATPIAVVEVTEKETKVIPIIDSTKLALAGMLMVAWNLFWITRTIRVFKSRQGIE